MNESRTKLPKESPNDYVLGEYAPFDVSPERFTEPDEKLYKTLEELVRICSQSDSPAHRFEVEQAWQARMYERGYQQLVPRKGGGFLVLGANSSFSPISTADASGLHVTNIYARDKDVICAALSRDLPKANFFPMDSMDGASVAAAAAANKFKKIYAQNNDLRKLLMQAAYYSWTEDRFVLHTAYVRDEQKYGSAVDPVSGEKVVNGRETTTIWGKLESKFPMICDDLQQMSWGQITYEMDVARARATFPWCKEQIKAGSTKVSEIELDRLARLNTRLGIGMGIVGGSSQVREVTVQRTWLRPACFFDEKVDDAMLDRLLEIYPKGCLVVYAGEALAYARPENMDDHLSVGHALMGVGQNRRALGDVTLPVQKSFNLYKSLTDAFCTKTVPRKWYHSRCYDIKALKSQDNVPGGAGPVTPPAGLTIDQTQFTESTPQAQPMLGELMTEFFDNVPKSLDGAVDSLFGSADMPETVGASVIQKDAALARIGVPWNMAKAAFTEAFRQAVICAAANRAAGTQIAQNVGQDYVSLSVDDLKGAVQVFPEYDESFPETWKEKDARFRDLVAGAGKDGNPILQKMLDIPKNLRTAADAMRMADLEIPGEISVQKQLVELDRLKKEPPNPNPAYQKLQETLQGMQGAAQRGIALPPQAPQVAQMLQQQLQKTPPFVTSVPVAQDASEEHGIEADTVVGWLRSQQGQQFKNGDPQQQASYQNALLHWQAHEEMKQKLATPPPGPQLHVSSNITDLPPNVAAEVMSRNNLQASPTDVLDKATLDTNHAIAQQVVPKSVPESIDVHKMHETTKPEPPKVVAPPPKGK